MLPVCSMSKLRTHREPYASAARLEAHRCGVRATRSLVTGVEAFRAFARRAPDFVRDELPEFVAAHMLRPWFGPLVEDEESASVLAHTFRSELRAERAAAPARTRAQLDLCVEMRDALSAREIPSLLIKGLCVAERFYGDLHRRHQFDVDVLVRPTDFEAAVAALAPLGFDTANERVARRLRKMRTRRPERAPQTVTARRPDGLKLDLHCRTKSRWIHGIDESRFWAQRRTLAIGGHEFETLSDEHALLLLLASICVDLRRGACRAKHLLDLDLMLRELEPRLDWEAFFAAHAQAGLDKVAVNVLAVFLTVWETAAELPRLAAALERRRRSIELDDGTEALRLTAWGPRQRSENRRWFQRLGSRPGPAHWTWRMTLDLPHTLQHSVASPWRRGGAVPWAP